MNLQEREQYAKTVINDLRKREGKRRLGKLKRGERYHSGYCAVTNSLDAVGVAPTVDRKAVVILWRADPPQPKHRMEEYEDKELNRFVRDFDAGKYPELELPPTPIKVKKPGERKATVIG